MLFRSLYELGNYQFALYTGNALALYLKSRNKSIKLDQAPESLAVTTSGLIGLIIPDPREFNAKLFKLYDQNLRLIENQSWSKDAVTPYTCETSKVMTLGDGGILLQMRQAKEIHSIFSGWFTSPNYEFDYKLARYDRQGEKQATLGMKRSSVSASMSEKNGDILLLARMEENGPVLMQRLSPRLKSIWSKENSDIEYETNLYPLSGSKLMFGRGTIIDTTTGKFLRPPVYQGFTDHAPAILDDERQIFMSVESAIEPDGSMGAGWDVLFYYSF